jgi:hypothetical protein
MLKLDDGQSKLKKLHIPGNLNTKRPSMLGAWHRNGNNNAIGTLQKGLPNGR